MQHFADRLALAVKGKNSRLCVGIDPRLENLPDEVRGRALHDQGVTLQAVARAFEEFGRRVIQLTSPYAAAVKVQSAFYEALGPPGAQAFLGTLQAAREHGLMTIADVKRGDIGSTAEAYATAYVGAHRLGPHELEAFACDALTVNPLLGSDTLRPFVYAARPRGRGVFVLARTSNPGAGEFQDLAAGGKTLTVRIAEAVRAIGLTGVCGYSDVGIVVGVTYPEQLVVLREHFPELWFLIPGVGAQGGKPDEARSAFDSRGLGALINSSRGIIFAHEGSAGPWENAVERAARQTRDAINRALRI